MGVELDGIVELRESVVGVGCSQCSPSGVRIMEGSMHLQVCKWVALHLMSTLE